MTRYSTNTWGSDVETLPMAPLGTLDSTAPGLNRASSLISISSSWKATPDLHGFGGTMHSNQDIKHAQGFTYTIRGDTKHGHGSTKCMPTEVKYGYGGIYNIRGGPNPTLIANHLAESVAIWRYKFNELRENRLKNFPEPFPQIEDTSPLKFSDYQDSDDSSAKVPTIPHRSIRPLTEHCADDDDLENIELDKVGDIREPDVDADQKIPDFKQARYRSHLVRGVYPNSLSVDEMDHGADPSGLMTRVDADDDFDDLQEFELQNFDEDYDDADEAVAITASRAEDPRFKQVPYRSDLIRGVYPNSNCIDQTEFSDK